MRKKVVEKIPLRKLNWKLSSSSTLRWPVAVGGIRWKDERAQNSQTKIRNEEIKWKVIKGFLPAQGYRTTERLSPTCTLRYNAIVYVAGLLMRMASMELVQQSGRIIKDALKCHEGRQAAISFQWGFRPPSPSKSKSELNGCYHSVER